MPAKNSRKQYVPYTYYHVYSRGINKQPIFIDPQDYSVFLSYLKRYLSSSSKKRPHRKASRSFFYDLDLLCYCLISNHVHLLLYQHADERALPALLQRVFTTYSMYFNRKYNRVGPVFQSRYLASRISNDPYLHHISRYIHRNPTLWSEYEFSSLRYYTGQSRTDWVKPRAIMELFNDSPEQYLEFVAAMDEDDEEQAVDFMAHE